MAPASLFHQSVTPCGVPLTWSRLGVVASCRSLLLAASLCFVGGTAVAAEDEQQVRRNTSYALGMQFADNIRSSLPQWELDSRRFADGVKDGLSGGKLEISPAEISAQLRRVSDAGEGPPPPSIDMSKFSYALGAYSSGQLMIDTEELLLQHFLTGIQDMIDGITPLLSIEEAEPYLRAYFQKMRRKLQQRAKENLARNKSFFAKNGKRPEVKLHDSGMQYQIATLGDGPSPKPGELVVVHYRGTLLDGTEFDSSRKGSSAKPAKFSLEHVIKGWQIALPLMNTGATWRIWLPPELAYGERGAPPDIGPNQALMFEIELVTVSKN